MFVALYENRLFRFVAPFVLITLVAVLNIATLNRISGNSEQDAAAARWAYVYTCEQRNNTIDDINAATEVGRSFYAVALSTPGLPAAQDPQLRKLMEDAVAQKPIPHQDCSLYPPRR